MSCDPIVCRDTTWLVSDGRDRELTEEENAQLAAHIASCSMCQGASRQFAVLFRGIDALFKSERHNDDLGNDGENV